MNTVGKAAEWSLCGIRISMAVAGRRKRKTDDQREKHI